MLRNVTFPATALVRRELLTLLRNRRSFVVLVLFLLIPGVVVAGAFASMNYDAGLTSLGQESQLLLSFLSFFFLVGACFLAPPLAAIAFTLEKERETFDMLHTTLIRPSGMVCAKLANILGFYLLLLIAAGPCVGTVLFLTGIDTSQLAVTAAILSSSLFASASAGILCSAWCNRSIVSILISYLITIILQGGYMIPLPFILAFYGFRGYIGQDILEHIVLLVPLYVMGLHAIGGGTDLVHVIVCVGGQLGAGVVCLALAGRILRRPPRVRAPKDVKLIDDEAVLRERREKFPYYLIDPLKRKKQIEDGRNPVLVRELRWGMPRKATYLVRTTYLSFAVFMVVGALMVVEMDRSASRVFWPFPYAAVQIVLVALALPPLIATALTRELEQGQLDLLRITLLRPRQILMGKTAASALVLVPALAMSLFIETVLFLYSLLDCGGDIRLVLVFLIALGTLATCIVYSSALTIFASALSRRLTMAILGSYALSLMLYLFLPALVPAAVEISSGWLKKLGLAPEDWYETLGLFMSPPFAAGYAAGKIARILAWSHEMGWFLFWAMDAAVFMLISAGLMWVSARIVRRQFLKG